MPGYRDLSVRRTIAKRSFPSGSVVLTPTGRQATVVGYYNDGTVDLRYTDGCASTDSSVRLAPNLLRRAP